MAITSANGCGGTALFTGLLEVGPADPTENKGLEEEEDSQSAK